MAIDGKTLRRSHNRRDGVPAIHMVSAWSSENGLVLGQHWGIENQLAIMRHIALNLIKNDTSRKASMKRKRFMAALEDDFRETIIRQVI